MTVRNGRDYMVSPILKWPGGKFRLSRHVFDKIVEREEVYGEDWHVRTGQRYHEPFTGAGGMYLGLRKRGLLNSRKKTFLSDLSFHLSTTLEAIQGDSWTEVSGLLGEIKDDYLEALKTELEPRLRNGRPLEERFYYRKRKRFNELYDYIVNGSKSKPDVIEFAALMVFLNKVGYNGIWRVNSSGYYNVPEGESASYNNVHEHDKLRGVHHALKDTVIHHRDWKESFRDVRRGDLVYLDPPYLPLEGSKGTFNQYSAVKFERGDHWRLASESARLVSKKGCRMIVSNHHTEEVVRLYSEAAEEESVRCDVYKIPKVHNVNRIGEGRVEINEALFFISNFT